MARPWWLAAGRRLTGHLTGRHDALAVVTLAVFAVLAEWPLLAGRVVGGLDSLTQFYPWYALVGERLRAGLLPGWNPHSMAGGPLAGNPLSGWAYLPAMVAFTALPLGAAVVAFQLFHALLATLAGYALARRLGLSIAGAILASVAYGQSGLIAVEAACCFAFVSVGAWLPVLLLGTDLAIHADGWIGRVRGWALAALALSQILASWLGQGSYYALLVFGSFVLFRVLSRPPGNFCAQAVRPMRGDARAASLLRTALGTSGRLALHVAAPVLLGTSLAAAGLLPRIELNALSSLAGGYAEADQRVGGWALHELAALVEPGYWYAGLTVVGLALAGAWVARRRPLTWYLLALGVTLMLLAMPSPSPVHDLFGVLPGFARLHPHLPDRIMTVFFLVPALLAGLALDRLTHPAEAAGRAALSPRRAPLTPQPPPPQAGAEEPDRNPSGAPSTGSGQAWRLRVAAAALVVAGAFADLRAARELAFASYATADSVHTLLAVDVGAYYAPTPAGRFLQERLAVEGPFRFFGYGPEPSELAYTQRFAEPATVRLGVNNRAVPDRLLDVQGYDAIHLARFDALLHAANGRGQNYHNADVFAAGLRSPLLEMLAARYVVTLSTPDATGEDGSALVAPRATTVFDDGHTRVLRDGAAYPWAWIVHEARPASAADALAQIERGDVDPRRTALLEPPLHSPLDPRALLARLTDAPTEDRTPAPRPPSIADDPAHSGRLPRARAPGCHPADPDRLPLSTRERGAGGEGPCPADAVTVLDFESERLLLRARTDAPGILVLSEVAYPGWQAAIDGAPAPIYVANGLLRAVALPPGEHLVELRFESTSLRVGVVVSLLTALALAGGCLMPIAVSRPGPPPRPARPRRGGRSAWPAGRPRRRRNSRGRRPGP